MVNNWSISDANGDDNGHKTAAVINQLCPLGLKAWVIPGQAFPPSWAVHLQFLATEESMPHHSMLKQCWGIFLIQTLPSKSWAAVSTELWSSVFKEHLQIMTHRSLSPRLAHLLLEPRPSPRATAPTILMLLSFLNQQLWWEITRSDNSPLRAEEAFCSPPTCIL